MIEPKIRYPVATIKAENFVRAFDDISEKSKVRAAEKLGGKIAEELEKLAERQRQEVEVAAERGREAPIAPPLVQFANRFGVFGEGNDLRMGIDVVMTEVKTGHETRAEHAEAEKEHRRLSSAEEELVALVQDYARSNVFAKAYYSRFKDLLRGRSRADTFYPRFKGASLWARFKTWLSA